jgi:hypothetical protein
MHNSVICASTDNTHTAFIPQTNKKMLTQNISLCTKGSFDIRNSTLDEPNLIAESHRTQDMDADFKP